MTLNDIFTGLPLGGLCQLLINKYYNKLLLMTITLVLFKSIVYYLLLSGSLIRAFELNSSSVV